MNKKILTRRLFFYTLIVFLILLFVILSLRFFFSEDSWIKDSRGVYVKHGSPSNTPQEVSDQQDAINGAVELYKSKKIAGMNFSSQCLGSILGYAVDIVHVPRAKEDDSRDNQCPDFIQGKVVHFIELDRDGNVVSVV